MGVDINIRAMSSLMTISPLSSLPFQGDDTTCTHKTPNNLSKRGRGKFDAKLCSVFVRGLKI